MKGVDSDQWGIAGASLAACGDESADPERCSYPDSIAGTFNQSLTYQCPTLLSLPHFLQVTLWASRYIIEPFSYISCIRCCVACNKSF